MGVMELSGFVGLRRISMFVVVVAIFFSSLFTVKMFALSEVFLKFSFAVAKHIHQKGFEMKNECDPDQSSAKTFERHYKHNQMYMDASSTLLHHTRRFAGCCL